MSSLIIKAESPAYGGYAVGKWNGKVVLIKGALPGETVQAVIEEEKRDYCKASVAGIREQSPFRIAPECGLFGACGGCQLQYASYSGQLALKEEVLSDCLRRLAKLEARLAPALFHPTPWNYRCRGQFKTGPGGTGFYKEKTREVVEIDSCLLMADPINASLPKIKALMKENPGLFRSINEIHITAGDSILALIRTASHADSARAELASLFLHAGFPGVFIESRGKGLAKYGEQYTTFELEGLRYTVSPMSFFQGHWKLNQAVVSAIRDRLQPLKGKRVLDLYSGAGNFSLPLAEAAGEVIAVEENQHAIEDGRRNLEINKITNYRFIRSSAEDAPVIHDAHILILDPPRLGLSNKVAEKVFAMTPERIAYISCNPSTLARDLKKFLARYEMESVGMIDFFPQTYHIESLTILRLK